MSTCYRCGIDRTLREGLWKEGNANGSAETDDDKRRRKGSSKSNGDKEGEVRTLGRNEKVGHTRDSAGRLVEADTSRQTVDGESLASLRNMSTAEAVQDNLS